MYISLSSRLMSWNAKTGRRCLSPILELHFVPRRKCSHSAYYSSYSANGSDVRHCLRISFHRKQNLTHYMCLNQICHNNLRRTSLFSLSRISNLCAIYWIGTSSARHITIRICNCTMASHSHRGDCLSLWCYDNVDANRFTYLRMVR